MPELPPPAFEYAGWDAESGRQLFLPVEAPPCGDHLFVPDHDIDLRCDLPKGHEDAAASSPLRPFKHRAILARDQGHYVTWCDGMCAHPCPHIADMVPFLQRVQRSSS